MTDGLDLIRATTQRLDEGEDLLSLGAWLRRTGLEAAAAAAVSQAATARRRARPHWTRWDQLVFTRAGLEQASDPEVSGWRALRFAGLERAADVACGLGGDTIALAGQTDEVVALDVDESRLVLLQHNAAVAGVRPHLVLGDASRAPLSSIGFLHADPSRRTHRGRARRLADYRPPIGALGPLLREASGAAVVVSPGVALDDPDLPHGELEFVQVGRDLTEAVVWTGELATSERPSATVLSEGNAHHRSPANDTDLPVGDVGEWLIEPAPAAVRARLHGELGAEIGAWRIARHRALLTADQPPPVSPWWRAGEVRAVLPLRAKALRAWLAERRDDPLEFVVHGLDLDLDAWWRATGKPNRSWGGNVAHLIRLDDSAACVVTAAPATHTPDGSGRLLPEEPS